MKEYTVKVFDDHTEWYFNGKLHRDNDLPAIEYADGDKDWYQNGKLHRDNDLPGIDDADGHKAWYQFGKLHRDNGPAIERADGTKEWYIDGEWLSEEEFLSRQNTCNINGKTFEIDGKKYTLTLIK